MRVTLTITTPVQEVGEHEMYSKYLVMIEARITIPGLKPVAIKALKLCANKYKFINLATA